MRTSLRALLASALLVGLTASTAWAQPGQVLRLDGADDYVSFASHPAFDLSGDFTLEAWVYPTANQHAMVLSTDDGTAGTYSLRVLENGRLNFDVRDSGAVTSGEGVVPLNAWSHIAAVHDAASDSTWLYLDGHRVTALLGHTPSASGQPMFVGRYSGGQYFPGQISAIRVWRETRTPAQLRSTMHVAYAHDPNGALTEFVLDGNATSTQGDIAGTASGGATFVPSTAPLFERTANGPGFALSPSDHGNGGGAMRADGVATSVAALDAFTIEARVLPNRSDTYHCFLTFETNAGGDDLRICYDGRSGSSSSHLFYVSVGGDGELATVASQPSVWHHVALTLQNGTGQLFVNGQRQATFSTSAWPDSDGRFYAGHWAGEAFDGLVDEVRVWDHVVPSNVLADRMSESVDPAVYQATGGRLVAYYRFDENNRGGLAHAYDLSGGHRGSLSDGAWWSASQPLALADLEVTLSPTTATLASGAQTEVVAYVTNRGEAARNVRLTLAADGLSLAATGGDGSVVVSGNEATWDIETLDASTSASYRFRVTGAGTQGKLSAELVASSLADPDSGPSDGAGDDFAVQGFAVAPPSASSGFALAPSDHGAGYVQIADADALDLGSAFTLEAWIQPASVDGPRTVFSKDGNGTAGSYSLRVINGALSYETRGGGSVSPSFANSVRAGYWQHVAATYDASTTPNVRLYVNGAHVASGNVDAPTPNGNALLLGSFQPGRQVFDGRIDEARVWNVALSQTDLQATMGRGLRGDEAGLVAYYRFDENNAGGLPSAVDAAGGDHSGDLLTGAWWAASDAPVGGQPDLAITLAPQQAEAAIGDPLVFDLTVRNEGAAAATGVQVALSDAVNLGPLGGTPPPGTAFDGQTWKVLALPVDASKTLTVTTTASGGLAHLAAQVSELHQDDTDSTPGDGRGDDAAEASVLPVDMPSGGNALAFDGIDDGLLLANPPSFGGAFTVEAWIRVTGGGHAPLINQPGGFQLLLLSDGRIEYNTPSDFLVSAAGTLARDRWQHVALTYDPQASPSATMWVNGAPVASASQGAGGRSLAPGVSSQPVWIGYREKNALRWQGDVDELRTWSKARTGDEIRSTLFAPLVGNEQFLTGYYRFELLRNLRANSDGTDDIQDHSGNERHLDSQGGVALLPSSAPVDQGAGVTASDDVYEDRVIVQWKQQDAPTQFVQVLRDGKLLASVSSRNEEYEDPDGRPYTTYVYCVVTQQANGTRTTLGCDGGRRKLFPAEEVAASDGLYDDKVRVTWTDRSDEETGYRVYRDDELLAVVGPNVRRYDDVSAIFGPTHTYCVAPEQDGSEGSQRRCDDGAVGQTLPIRNLTASDGTYPNFVQLSWLDQGSGATAFRLYRDGALLHDINLAGGATAEDTQFEDRTATPGQVHTYCVRRMEGPAAAVDVCDEGSINTLRAPGSLAATDGEHDDRVAIGWTDRTGEEDGYRVYRRGGSALVFDGTDDFIYVPAASALNPSGAFTVEAWIRLDADQHGVIVATDDASTTGTFMLRVLQGQKLNFEIRGVGSVTASSADIPLGQWAHVAVAHDGSTARLYVDGTLVEAGALSPPSASGHQLLVGRYVSGQHFAGAIDELRMWRVARSQHELRSALFAPLTGDESGLVAYYPFDQGSGANVRDAYGIHSALFPQEDAHHPAWSRATAPLAQHGAGLALSLDGTDDYAEVAPTAAFDLPSAFTLEAWIHRSSDRNATILSNDQGAPGAYLFRVLEGGALNYEVRGAESLSSLPGTVPLQQWTHVAVVYDAATTTNTRLFVNGHQVHAGTATAPSAVGNPAYLGRMSSGQYWSGMLDDVRLWHVARDEKALRSTMHRLGESTDGLAGRFTFDAIVEADAGIAGFNDIRDAVADATGDLVGSPYLWHGVDLMIAQLPANASGYDDYNADTQLAYTYCATAFTEAGVETAPVCDEGVRGAAARPGEVTATDREFENRVELSWTDPSTRTSFFKVLRDGVLIQTMPVSTLQHTDDQIASDVEYTYCVVAVSGEGLESAPACDRGSRSIQAPSEVSAGDDAQEARVTITWVDNSSVEGGYRVYRRAVLTGGALDADSALVEETFPSVTEVLDAAGTPGTTYRYSVVAFDSLGVSRIATDRGSRRLNPPANVAAEDGHRETEIRITWEDKSQAETGYRVYRDGVLLAGDLPKNTQEYVDLAPVSGTTTYAVEAVDAYGASVRNADTGYTTLLPPGEVAATDVYETEVRISWSDASQVESGFALFRDGVLFDYVGPNDISSYDVSDPIPGTTYEYCVATWQDDGDGLPWTGGAGSAPDADDVFSPHVCDAGTRLRTPPPVDPTAFEVQHFVADGTEQHTRFGEVVRIAGDQMFVGAYDEEKSRGAVYVYERTDGGWTLSEKLTASDGQEGAHFGFSLDASGDWLIVGSFRHWNPHGSASSSECDGGSSQYGRVYWFERTTDGWVERERYTHNNLNCNANFGYSVSLDGAWSMVGALNDGAGSIYIYRLDGDSWRYMQGMGTPSTADVGNATDFGAQVEISDNIALATAPRRVEGKAPEVYLYERNTDNWERQDWNGLATSGQSQPTETGFGFGLDRHENLIAVTARGWDEPSADNVGLVKLFRFVDESGRLVVRHAGTLQPPTEANLWFGRSVSMSATHILVGANGRAYLYRYSEDGTTFTATLERVYQAEDGVWDDHGNVGFGRSVHIRDGNVIVSDNGADRVYIDEVNPTPPSEVAVSDGAFENRVEMTWQDDSDNEDGFRIFRGGELIHTTAADETAYIDVDAEPGVVYEYCVQAVRAVYGDVSEQACALGWRFPDGSVAGKVMTTNNTGSQDMNVCLTPAPNGALVFDGQQGYARTADAAPLPSTWTVEFWARRGTDQSGDQVLFSHGIPQQNDGLNIRLNGGTLFFDLHGDVVTVSAPTDAGWHHYAFTFNGAGNSREVFIDGASVFREPRSGGYGGDGPFALGTWAWDESSFFEGLMDEVRVWDTALGEASVQARMSQTVRADEPGLFAHWSLDERKGRFSANDVVGDENQGGRLYLRHAGGVAPIRPGAPIQTCTSTGPTGDYRIAGVRYGESTEFVLRPSDPDPAIRRTFAPQEKSIILSRENPVQNELVFVDASRYGISGVVQYAGTQCPVENVQIEVNGDAMAMTDDGGNFSTSNDPEPVFLQPISTQGPRTFEPASRSFALQSDVFEQNFVVTTQHKLVGRVAGGSSASCRQPIGRARVLIKAQNGCFERTIETNAQGHFTEYLPPMKYFVQVLEVDLDGTLSPTQKIDATRYFERQGAALVDLGAEAEVEHNLIYIAPLVVSIQGLPASQCSAGDVTDNLPILTSGNEVDLTFTVQEDYGNGNLCAVDSAQVLVYNEIADLAAPDTLTITSDDGGSITKTYAVGEANPIPGRIVDQVDRSYQKYVSAVAQVGANTNEATQWAFIEGTKVRPGGQFATVPSVEIPLWVLHDPPGDHSYAYLEKGSSQCVSLEQRLGVALESETKAGVGVDFGVDGGFSFTAHASANSLVDVDVKAGLKVYASSATNQTFGQGFCVEATERIQTSDDEDFFGPNGDVFVGVGSNLIFSTADAVKIDQCAVDVDQALALEMDVATTFAYSRHHIENELIPRLEMLKDVDESRVNDLEAGIRHYENWLARADAARNKERDDRETYIEDQLGAEDRSNLSFDSGTIYEYAHSRDESFSSTTDVDVTLGIGVWADIELALGAAILIESETMVYANLGLGVSVEKSSGSTVGFVLNDDDQGDSYTVDVYRNPDYDTPVFDVLAAQSSCPYEPWVAPPLDDFGAPFAQWEARSAPRDLPKLRVNPPALFGVDPTDPALFTLFLENQSATGEDRNYRIRQLTTSNPGGAQMRLGGQTLGAIDYRVGGQQTQETELSIRRGPRRYNYDRLGLVVYPRCEEGNLDRGEAWGYTDTLYVDVGFEAPCSEIRLLRPQPSWTLNAADQNVVDLLLSDFSMPLNDRDEGVEEIGMEYRRAGTDDAWLPAFSASRQEVLTANDGTDLDDITGYGFTWDFTEVYDGAFEYRAYTSCPAGKFYSESVEGTVDRQAPRVLGTPSPQDRFLSTGDDIALSFNEPIACDSVFTSGADPNVTLRRVDTGAALPVQSVCNGTDLVLDLQPGGGWAALEGVELEARVDGITDLARNPMEAPKAWRFVVRRSAFGFALADVGLSIPQGQTDAFNVPISNGRTSAVAFTIEQLPTWLSASPVRGTLEPGAALDIAFQVAAFDTIGAFTDTVRVASDAGAFELPVAADVYCAPGQWHLSPQSFPYTMSLTAQLYFNGVAADTSADMLAAVVDGEVRGIANVQAGPGGNRVHLTIYGREAGETVGLQAWDHSACRLYESTSRSVLFTPDQAFGTPVQPVSVHAPTDPTPATVRLAAGWTLFSPHVTPLSSSFADVVVAAGLLSTPGDVIKSQTDFAIYDADAGWVGPLAGQTVEPGRAYYARMAQAQPMPFPDGTPLDLGVFEVGITTGWNWVGFPLPAAEPINSALSLMTAQNGDYVKSHTAFAQYVDGAGWVGSLTHLRPGEGYKLRAGAASSFGLTATNGTRAGGLPEETLASAALSAKQVGQPLPNEPNVDPRTAPAKASAPDGEESLPEGGPLAGWHLDRSRVPESMSLVLRLDPARADVEGGRIGAFVVRGEEEHFAGAARPQHVDALDENRVFLLVSADADAQGRPIVLRYYDARTNRVEPLQLAQGTRLTFAADGAGGSPDHPLEIAGTEVALDLPSEFALHPSHPNPVRDVSRLAYDVPQAGEVVIEVFDAIGRRVLVLVDEAEHAPGRHTLDLEAARLASGVYVCRMRAGNSLHSQSLVIVR